MAVILEIKQSERQSYPLQVGVNRVGRSAENAVQVNDPSISSCHCEITIGPDGSVIRDLGSTNGTFVQGQRVEIAALTWDDPFRIGNIECVLRSDRTAQTAPGAVSFPRRANRIDREGWKALGIGCGLAILVGAVPLQAYIVDFLRVIIHETGHTATAWLLGYPTIPILRSGGGVSASLGRPPIMVVVMFAILGKLLHIVYRKRQHRLAATIAAAVYLLAAFTDLGKFLIVIMGHGTELLAASLFLYRAISGQSILTASERPLYATIALVIFGLDLRFAGGLLLGSETRMEYEEGFDGNSHDLVKIAETYLHVDLRSVVLGCLVLCLLAPCATFLYYRWRPAR